MKSLIQTINETLVREDLKNYETKLITSHHCSSAFDCKRKQYYKWKRVKRSNPPDGANIMKMEIGKKIEEQIVATLLLKDAKLQTQAEVKELLPTCNYPISGKIDTIVELEGTKTIIEIKSGMGRYIAALREANKPRTEHLNQTIQYLIFNKESINDAAIFYQARDSSMQMEFWLKKDIDVILLDGIWYCDIASFKEKLGKYCQLVESYVLNDVIPVRDFFAAIKCGEIRSFQKDNIEYFSDYQCDYCDYANHCWAHELEVNPTTTNALSLPERCRREVKKYPKKTGA